MPQRQTSISDLEPTTIRGGPKPISHFPKIAATSPARPSGALVSASAGATRAARCAQATWSRVKRCTRRGAVHICCGKCFILPDHPLAERLSKQTFLLSEFLEKEAPDFRPPRLEGT